MKWHKVSRYDKTLMTCRPGDYLFNTNDIEEAWEEVLCHLYAVSYVDTAAINVINICTGKQEVRTRNYYTDGSWYYLPSLEGPTILHSAPLHRRSEN